MERSFTSFLIPMILVLILFMWFSGGDDQNTQAPPPPASQITRSVEGEKAFQNQPRQTYAQVKDHFKIQEEGSCKVKGKVEPVLVFEVIEPI